MIDRSDEPENPNLRLPPRLVADLRSVAPAPPVRPELDAAVLNTYRRVMARRRRFRVIQIAVGSGAMAAAIGLVVMLRITSLQHPSSTDPRDLNVDGRIDILDAFALARRIEAAESLPAWDFNHDGQVDRRDVDVIAADAVKLSNLSTSIGTPRGSGAEVTGVAGVAQASRLCSTGGAAGSLSPPVPHQSHPGGGAS